MASARAPGFCGGTKKQLVWCPKKPGDWPAAVIMHGTPTAIASAIVVLQVFSIGLRAKKRLDSRSIAATSDLAPVTRTWSPTPNRSIRRWISGINGPSPTIKKITSLRRDSTGRIASTNVNGSLNGTRRPTRVTTGCPVTTPNSCLTLADSTSGWNSSLLMGNGTRCMLGQPSSINRASSSLEVANTASAISSNRRVMGCGTSRTSLPCVVTTMGTPKTFFKRPPTVTRGTQCTWTRS